MVSVGASSAVQYTQLSFMLVAACLNVPGVLHQWYVNYDVTVALPGRLGGRPNKLHS